MVSRPRRPGFTRLRPGARSGHRFGNTGGQQIPTPGYPGQDRPVGRPQDQPAQAPQEYPVEQVPGQQGDPMGNWPIPHRTWRTRSGSQVTVAGCCLPLPIGCLTTVAAGAAVGLARLRARR